MTTITLPRRLGMPALGRIDGRGFLLGFSITVAVAFVLIAIASVVVAVASRGEVLPRVSVGGVEIGGLDPAAAQARLEATLPSLSAGEAVLVAGRDEVAVGYAAIGRGYRMNEMVAAAYGIGRDGNPYLDTISRLRAALVGESLPVQVHAFDPASLEHAAAGAAAELHIPTVDAAVTPTGASFRVSPSTTGREVDVADVRNALATAAATTDPADVRLVLSVGVTEPTVSTADAEAAAVAARAMTTNLELTVPGAAEGDEPMRIGAATIAGWIDFGPTRTSPYAAVLDHQAIAAAIGELADGVDREARNAGFSLAAVGIGGVIPGQDGRELDVSASAAALVEALEERGSGGGRIPSLALVVDVTEPELTTAEAEAALPQMQMVSGWTTNYPPHNGSAYNPNIVIPANEVDGTVLLPGREFSFWAGIGPVTVERGYTYGGAIINGRSVPDGALAGGICSTSTTLFNAALRYGLQMGDRLNHYYFIDRYPTGLDATVYTDGTWTQDMTFTNDTAYPIVIRGFGGSGWVRFELWTVPDGRSVAFSNTVTSNHRSAIETTQVSSSLAPGQSQRVEYPHHGFNASVTRWVYDAQGALLHENNYFSQYRAVNGITLVGPTPESPPEPPPADEPPGTGDPPPPDPPDDP